MHNLSALKNGIPYNISENTEARNCTWHPSQLITEGRGFAASVALMFAWELTFKSGIYCFVITFNLHSSKKLLKAISCKLEHVLQNIPQCSLFW